MVGGDLIDLSGWIEGGEGEFVILPLTGCGSKKLYCMYSMPSSTALGLCRSCRISRPGACGNRVRKRLI